MSYGSHTQKFDLYVVPEVKQILFRLEWLRSIQLDWAEIHSLHDSVDFPPSSNPELNTLLKNYQGVFQGGLGTLKDVKVKFIVPDESTPKFFKARNVPYALEPKVEMEQSKVEYSKWAAPIVPVVKTDGNVRICGDCKVTENPVLQDVTYSAVTHLEVLS